jgi:hypothetical protein
MKTRPTLAATETAAATPTEAERTLSGSEAGADDEQFEPVFLTARGERLPPHRDRLALRDALQLFVVIPEPDATGLELRSDLHR